MEMGTRGQSAGDPLQADRAQGIPSMLTNLRGTGLGHSLPGCSHHNSQSVGERKITEEKFCLCIPQTMTHMKMEESSFLKIILKGGKFRHMLQPGCTLKTWCSVK